MAKDAIQISSLTIDAVNWTPFTVPFACKLIRLRNVLSVDVKYRTDSADPNTEDTLTVGESFDISSHGTFQGMALHTFEKNSTPLYFKAASGTGAIKIHCVL